MKTAELQIRLEPRAGGRLFASLKQQLRMDRIWEVELESRREVLHYLVDRWCDSQEQDEREQAMENSQ